MAKFSHIVNAGRVDTVKEIRKVAGKQEQANRARSLVKSAIGSEGLRIHSEGSLTIDDGGDIHVNDGGMVNVRDGGQIITRHPTGIASTWAGSFNDNGEPGYGFLVQRQDATDIFAATSRPSGDRVVMGSLPNPIEDFVVYSFNAGVFGDNSVSLISEGAFGILIETRAGPINLESTGGVYISHTTVGSGPTCTIGTDGLIQRISSSRRYKQDIQDIEVDPDAVLKLRPRTWRDKNAVADDPEAAPRHVGFIAEELDEAGLTEFVSYDEHGPEGIHYDRLSVGLLAVIKRQQSQLDSQQSQIAALSARLDALEA